MKKRKIYELKLSKLIVASKTLEDYNDALLEEKKELEKEN